MLRNTLLVLPIVKLALAATPVAFYTDLESGPNAGGENNGGAFVTLYGNHFGSSRDTSTVTVGGSPVAAYPIWSDTKITFQLGPLATTGKIVATVKGQTSTGVPFTVRPGNVYFIAAAGSDSNKGTFKAPWATLQHAADTMLPGDTVYCMDGTVEGTTPNGDGSLIIRRSGTSGRPLAILAYPGATVRIGSTGTGPCRVDPCWVGIRNGGGFPQPAHWIFGGLHVRGQELALDVDGDETHAQGKPHDLRFVGNDFSCPWGATQQAACVTFAEVENVKFYGNSVHDVSTANEGNARSEYHGLYFSTDSLHLDIGWNRIFNIAACIGIQFHSTSASAGSGYNLYDFSVHDNIIHDTRCDGILIATVSPEQGSVSVYNNIIYNAGEGWPPGGSGSLPQGGGDLACIYVTGGKQYGPDTDGTVPIEIYNNTLYNCGSGRVPNGAGFTPAGISLGGYSPLLRLRIRNNIVYNRDNVAYTVDYSRSSSRTLGRRSGNLFGEHNIFYGNSQPTPATGFTPVIAPNSLVVTAKGYDFHLVAGSPAIDGGTPIDGLVTDFEGNVRPQGSKYDIGAYEYSREVDFAALNEQKASHLVSQTPLRALIAILSNPVTSVWNLHALRSRILLGLSGDALQPRR